MIGLGFLFICLRLFHFQRGLVVCPHACEHFMFIRISIDLNTENNIREYSCSGTSGELRVFGAFVVNEQLEMLLRKANGM